MNESARDIVVERLEQLERVNRWWRIVGSVAIAALGLILLLGATGPKLAKEIWAERFVLADRDGTPRAELSMEPSAGLHIFSKDGKRLAELAVDGWAPRLFLRGGDLKGGAMIEVLPDGTAIVNLRRSDSNGQAWLAVSRRGRSSFHLRGRHERGRVEVTVAEDGSPKLALYDKERERHAVLDGSSNLTLYGKNGRPRAVLGLLVDDFPVLDLRDKAGNPRAALDVRLDGSPSLTFYDKDGVDRTDFLLGADGSPGLELRDEKGTRRLALGASVRKPATGKREERRPVSSLVLFDDKGDVIWAAP